MHIIQQSINHVNIFFQFISSYDNVMCIKRMCYYI
nr:MAG TPA: hypothetical protein [Caudoviricetes sp.]